EEPVCIKHAHYVSPQDEEIIRKEAKAIWDLRHHSLPAMRDMFRMDDGSFALVMSYIPGPTLEQIIQKNGKLDSEHVAWISERALSALWYLHLNGVVHGDVKPQNIIVQPESHAMVLVDYGLAAVKPSSNTKAIGYTPYFASPEQEKGCPLVPESDFYSLGMTMIYALGGDVGKKRVPSNVPDALRDFIADLIVHDVNSRPNWEKANLIEQLADVRTKAFGRRRSSMAKIPNF
ncbi:protein kinase, partial [Candidatus Woesearchaeota archaeon]|nr:protein kinase [Candidatus Woesearchaeota archaeon]